MFGKNIWNCHLGVALCDTKMADETCRLRMAEFSIMSIIFYANITRIDIVNVFKEEKRLTSAIIFIFIATSIIVTKLCDTKSTFITPQPNITMT